MAEPKKLYSLFVPRPPKPPAQAAPPVVPPPPVESVSSAPPPAASTSSAVEPAPESTTTDSVDVSKKVVTGTSASQNGEGTPAAPPSASASSSKLVAPVSSKVSSKTKRSVAVSKPSTPSITVDDDGDSEDDAEVQVVTSAAPRRVKKLRGSTSMANSTDEEGGKSEEDEDDDELIIVEGYVSAASSNASKSSKRRTGAGKGKLLGKNKSSTPVITIPDSPPKKKKKKAVRSSSLFGGGSGSSFAPLSQLHRASREKRKANEPILARWPTREEHGSNGEEGQKRPGSLVERTERWTSTEGTNDKGKGKAIEVDGIDYFASLVRRTSTSTSSTSFPNPPKHVQHPLTSIPSLLPPSLPSHPLLNRLSTPFLPSINKSKHPSFLRPSDFDTKEALSAGYGPGKELWPVKYAPKSAEEVLGEESGLSAKWLKEWLNELKVWSAEDDTRKRRRPIARGLKESTKKRRKRAGSDLDDFIASDDDEDDMDAEEEEVVASGSEEESDDDGGGPSFRPTSSSTARSVFPSLTNLLLLVGPHGSGKSSTVQAVASELGWDIFEVYPGIGKRGAKDVEKYVGDVGRNHQVQHGGGGSPRKGGGGGGLLAMFGKQMAKKTNGAEKGKVEETKGRKGGAQSLILFEEVDVLYREEKDFWPGLINLVKESRRPVIMTCSDLSQLPWDDLNLQTVILPNGLVSQYFPFKPPPPQLTSSFLQLVALNEGHLLNPSSLTSLYSTISATPRPPSYLIEGPSHPLPHPFPAVPDELIPTPDLRKSLMRLQFECQWAVGDRMGSVGWMDLEEGKEGRTSWSEGTFAVREEKESEDGAGKALGEDVGEALEKVVRASDALSFGDAFVARRTITYLEYHESYLGVPSAKADQEINFPWLPTPRFHSLQLPLFARDVEMDETLVQLAKSTVPTTFSHSEKELLDLYDARYETVQSVGLVVASSELVTPPAPILPSPLLMTDYIPYLRLLTIADDLQEAASVETSGGGAGGAIGAVGGKRTLRSNASKYKRRLDLDESQVAVLRRKRFGE